MYVSVEIEDMVSSMSKSYAVNTPAKATPSRIVRDIRWATPLSHDENHRDVDTGNIRYRHVSCIMDENEGEAVREEMEHCLLRAEEPVTLGEALEDATWKNAMDTEMDSITINCT